METPTLIEAKLCKLWASADSTGEWFAMFEELSDIAQVMYISGQPDAGCLFHEAATHALDRQMYSIRMRAAA